MPLNMIVAVNPANKIGFKSGELPWHIPGDLKRFKALTTGCAVIMGFNTYLSIKPKFPKGFPGRKNHVVTTKPVTALADLMESGISVSDDLPGLCRSLKEHEADRPVWICGGATLYDQLIGMQLVDNIYLTVVNADTAADVELSFELASWKLFVLQQAKQGVYWEVSDIIPNSEAGCPDYTFITLAKSEKSLC